MTASLLRCRFATLGTRLVKETESDVLECKIKNLYFSSSSQSFKICLKEFSKVFHSI